MSANQDRPKEVYANDIVYRLDRNKKITFGVVVDSFEASSDVADSDPLQRGQIRVLWNSSSRERVWNQNRVKLMARCIIPGDIVRRLEKGKETQRGYCKETKRSVTVQVVGTDKVIEHVSSTRLHGVRPFDVDDVVSLGNKFGRIEGVDQEVTMSSKCGSVVQILTSINHDIEDYWLIKRNRNLFEAFYPGQELICTPFYFVQPQWIRKSKIMKKNAQKRQRFTVQSVKDSSVEVRWCNESTVTILSPAEVKQLKVLERDTFDDYLDLTSRHLLKLNPYDVLLKKRDWQRKLVAAHRREAPKARSVTQVAPKVSESNEDEWTTDESDDSDDNNDSAVSVSSNISRKKHYPPRPDELVAGNTVAVEIVCMECRATIVWQDGTEERNVPSTQLYYSISIDDHEFVPGEWVVHESGERADEYGVVQRVDYLERTASVKWFSDARPDAEPRVDEPSSVYELRKHQRFAFRPGSVVRAAGRVGTVVDSSAAGVVRVRWIDGDEAGCRPRDIELVPEFFEPSESSGSDGSDGDVSWETETIESYAGDVSDETTLQNVAARLDFVRNRLVYLGDAFAQRAFHDNNLEFMRDLLLIYDNSSYLDKLLGTSFFCLKSVHFKVLLLEVKEKARRAGIELKGRLFANDNLAPCIQKLKNAEKENINKVIKIENRVNAQIGQPEGTVPSEPNTPDSAASVESAPANLCLELISMLKLRMDLAYAEIISKLDGAQGLSIMTQLQRAPEPRASRREPARADDLFSLGSATDSAEPSEPFATSTPAKGGDAAGEPAYAVLDDAPPAHHFHAHKFEPTDHQRFLKAMQREHKLLQESLPPGVWVRFYGNRIDLLSVMIEGPAKTPYEDGLFVFDMQLSRDYPRSPPLVHYVCYSSERLNPNLYVEGKVCVSLLGTWMGRGSEVWGPKSTLLQLIVSIQGLILVSEPYFNEAGYEKQTDTQQGYENSRTYNELVVLKLVQSMHGMALSPPEIFRKETLAHFAAKGAKMCDRLESYCLDVDPVKPEFPLLPVSKGLKLSLKGAIKSLRKVLEGMDASG